MLQSAQAKEEVQRNFGFGRDASFERGIEELSGVLGPSNSWFVELIKFLSEEKAKGNRFTDVLVVENRPIMVGVLKNFYPVPFTSNGKPFLPTRDSLQVLVRSLTKRSTLPTNADLDFSFSVYGFGILRGNYSRDMNGVGIAFRYLDFNLPDFDFLGYPEVYRNLFKSLVKTERVSLFGREYEAGSVLSGGLILHVGPTGSGKSTAIAGEIGYLAQRISGLIITYENPVEYRFIHLKAPVRQYELGYDLAGEEGQTDFDRARNHLLRNAPSVAMIGEVRSFEEIDALIDIASRGHLVFSTMHAGTVGEALRVLLSRGEHVRLKLAGSLRAIVAHRLIFSETGDIVPMLEIFIPDQTMRTFMAEGDVKSIYKQFYLEKTNEKLGMPFSVYLRYLVVNGRLAKEEAERIARTFHFMFEDLRARV